MSEEVLSPANRARQRALEAVNRAALAISSKLSLHATLLQIVNSARNIAEAEYAAIGEFDSEGRIETFVTSGMPPEDIDLIDHEPIGLGLLGAILDGREPIRVPRIEDDPRSVGFPAGHPPMVSFLGVPIMAGSSVLGNLYLTDKKGADRFSDDDVEMIVILANHAAVAIENAHLYEASQKRARELKARNRELAAVNAVARVMSERVEIDELLQQTLGQVLHVTGMDAGEVYLLEESSGELHLAANRGIAADSLESIKRFHIGEGFPGVVVETGQPITTTDLASERSYLRKEVIEAGFKSYACIPIWLKGAVIGTLGLASKHLHSFSTRDLSLLEAIGHQVGVAVENARLYEEIERLAISEERSRIGMDLHDGVIQSIYAVGLTLETTRLLMANDPEQAQELLGKAVEGLNDAIRDIRNFILDLRPHRFEGDLAQGLSRLVREFQANALVEVDFDANGKQLNGLPAPHARALFLTAQEALANVARHARASHVHLSFEHVNTHLKMQVEDDGHGFDINRQRQTVGHGLANMQARAEELGGAFTVDSRPGQGTTVLVTLPLPSPPTEQSATDPK
ncbi:MAG: GAF domain-containing sensor histidine kinase [Anaerolineales bacterium]